jgi:hypothetical protein
MLIGVGDEAAGCLDFDVAERARIARQHAQVRELAARGAEPGLEAEGPDRGEHVAAVRRRIDPRLTNGHLGKQKLEIDAGRLAGAHDTDFTGQRVGTTEAVDLAQVRRAHDGKQNLVASALIRRQVALHEERPPRGTAAHEQTGNGVLHVAIIPYNKSE